MIFSPLSGVKKYVLFLGLMLSLVVVFGIWRSCAAPDPNQKAVQQAVTRAVTAQIVVTSADEALTRHVQDSLALVASTQQLRMTHQREVSLEKSLQNLEAQAHTKSSSVAAVVVGDPISVQLYKEALDTAHAVIDTLHAEVDDLTTTLVQTSSDNASLATALHDARQRLTSDTAVVLPPPQHRKFLGISVSSLKKLLPALTIQKDIIRVDLATGKPTLAWSSASVGIGWTIRF